MKVLLSGLGRRRYLFRSLNVLRPLRVYFTFLFVDLSFYSIYLSIYTNSNLIDEEFC